MEKKYLVGGLAVIGAVALFMYFKPKSKTSTDGFLNASGRTGKSMYIPCYNFQGVRMGGVMEGQKCPKGLTPVDISAVTQY